MLELKLYEAVSEVNSRGEMGRVVVPPSLPTDLTPRPTGKFYLCCNRFFLTLESFERHRKVDCEMTTVNDEMQKKSMAEIIHRACNQDKEAVKNEWKYSCTVVDIKRLVARKRSRNGAITFACRKCSYTSSNLQRIMKHVKSKHAEDLDQRRHIIQNANEDNNDEDEYRPSRFYKCDMCSNYESIYKWNIVLHKEKAHVKNGEYPCCYCTCRYEKQIGLTLHVNRVHSNMTRNNPNHIFKMENPITNPVLKRSDGGSLLNEPNAKLKFVDEWVQKSVEQLQAQNNMQQMEGVDSIQNQSTKTAFSYFKCGFCPLLFEEKVQLIKHHRQKHLSANPKETENPSNLLVKLEPKESKPIEILCSPSKLTGMAELTGFDTQCDLCEFIAKDRSDLSFHLKFAHVFLGVDCECGCSFARATELTNHKINDCVKRKTTNLISVKQETLKKYRCDCGQSFETRRKFSKHQEHDECKLNENVKPSINGGGKAINNSKSTKTMERNITQTELLGNVRNAESNNGERKSQCPYCKNLFKNDMGVRIHIFQMHKTASQQSFAVCEICKYCTKNYNCYHSHKKSCHVPGGIECPDVNCPCTFKTIEGLSTHFKVLHKGTLDRTKMELKCDQCDFVSYKLSDLEKHQLRGHSGDRCKVEKVVEIFNCEHCSFIAATPANLKRHIQTNHVENGVKCEICNNSFSTAMGARTHFNIMHKKTLKSISDEYSICKLCGYRTGSLKLYKEHHQRCHVGPIKCPECVCTFKQIEGMSAHVKMMHKKKVDKSAYLLKCNHYDCKYSTYSPASLNQHEKTAHPTHPSSSSAPDEKYKYLKCPICDSNMNGAANLQDHIERAHVENGFSCPEACKCSFRTEQGLSRHMIIKHGKKLNIKKEMVRDPIQYPVQCGECDFRSKDQNGINRHCLKMHGFSVPKTKRKRVCDICRAETSETLLSHKRRCHVVNGFKCLHPECSCSFETFHSRARHMMKVHQITTTKRCHLCKLKVVGTIAQHIKRCHVQNGLACEQEDCCCTFETEMGRLRHMQTRHKLTFCKQPKRCTLCGLVSSDLITHLSKCHVVDGLPCNFCSCSFETELGRTRHMRFRHNIKVSANCTTCGITPVVSMSAHIKQSHVAGGLPCTYCECAFKTERIRNRHLTTYHNVAVKPAKQCPLCSLFIRTSLVKHIQKHHVLNGYQCSYCNWSLQTEAGLRIHMFKQHKEHVLQYSKRDEKCQLCGMKVTESIMKHMERNHLSTNNFKCNYCCSKFSTSLGRSRHILLRHKNCQKKIASKKIARKRHQKSKTTKPFKIISTFSLASPDTKVIIDSPQFFPCLHCSCKFSSKLGRKTHVRLVHANRTDGHQPDPMDSPTEDITYTKIITPSPSLPKEKLTCSNCGYLATCKSHLNMHMQKSHVKNSQFKCNLCLCSYTTKSELIRHKKIFHPDRQ